MSMVLYERKEREMKKLGKCSNKVMDWIGCDCHFQNIPNQSRSSLQEVEEVEFERPAKQEEEKSFSRKRDVKEFSR